MIKCPLIIKELNKRGFKAYLVGGAVRDYLLGCETFDYDITTDALVSDLITLPYKIIRVNDHLGNVVFRLDNVDYEVTTFRIEEDYSDYRHPSKIIFSQSLFDDLKRRDFTINALCYDFEANQIIDIYNGQNDIKNHIIRTVGDANERFKEDSLRILRALRFSSVLAFKIDEVTESAIYNNYCYLQHLSWDRITSEFVKIVMGDYFFSVAQKYSDVFDYLFPGFNIFVTDDIISNMIKCDNKLDIKLSVLFKMFPNYKNIINSLSISKMTKIKINNFIECSFINCCDEQIALDVIKVIGLDDFVDYIYYLGNINYLNSQINILDKVYHLIVDKKINLNLNSIDITGEDLIRLGYQNKSIKDELVCLHKEVIFNKVENTNKQLLQKAKYHLQKSSRDDII